MTPPTAGTETRRVPGNQVAGGAQVKLSPGGFAELLNISATGALVESRHRLATGTRVMVAIGGDQPQRLEGEVLRSTVTAIHRDSTMTYQLAIVFSSHTTFSGVPEGQPAEPAPLVEAAPTVAPVNEW